MHRMGRRIVANLAGSGTYVEGPGVARAAVRVGAPWRGPTGTIRPFGMAGTVAVRPIKRPGFMRNAVGAQGGGGRLR